MKKNSVCLIAFLTLLIFNVIASHAQVFSEELRPFDFSDKYYQTNGLITEMLIGRKNGADGESLVDFTSDRRYANVRITATLPAYDTTGGPIYWNYYAGVSKAGFTEDSIGPRTAELAYLYPLYLFPSTTVKNSDRQAAIIRTGDSYFEKNPLGIAAVFLVEYTDKIMTKNGQATIQLLAMRNGVSLDGTPIIRTPKEIDTLYQEGLVTISQPTPDDRPPFAVAKILEHPEHGGIAPDAFLKYVKYRDGSPLKAEEHLLIAFECYKGGDCLR